MTWRPVCRYECEVFTWEWLKWLLNSNVVTHFSEEPSRDVPVAILMLPSLMQLALPSSHCWLAFPLDVLILTVYTVLQLLSLLLVLVVLLWPLDGRYVTVQESERQKEQWCFLKTGSKICWVNDSKAFMLRW